MKRRHFLRNTVAGAAGTMILPTIVPSSVFGKNAPSNKINIAQIGCGRIARSHDLAETMEYDVARVIAVCDVDKNRMADGKKQVEGFYSKKLGEKYIDVKLFEAKGVFFVKVVSGQNFI
jgi:hypothetical protein